jgi:hypothetical protein
MTVAEAIAAYLLHHESTNSQPKTLEWHTHCLGAFRTYCEHHELLPLEGIITEDALKCRSKPDEPKIIVLTRSLYTDTLIRFFYQRRILACSIKVRILSPDA